MPSTLAALRVLSAIRSVLLADATLTALLNTAPSAYGGGPGIYSEQDVPAGALFDYLTIGPISERPFNTMGNGLKWGSILSVQTKVLSAKRDVGNGYNVLDRLMYLLNGKQLTVNGYGSSDCELDTLVDSYSELVGGSVVKHFPAIWRVSVHQQS
jgi:hypothetical protein